MSAEPPLDWSVPSRELQLLLYQTRTGRGDSMKSLMAPRPCRSLNIVRSRAHHLSSKRAGSDVMTISRLALQCSLSRGACAAIAICDTRARMNSPSRRGSPATSGQIGDIQRASDLSNGLTTVEATKLLTSRSSSFLSRGACTVTVGNAGGSAALAPPQT